MTSCWLISSDDLEELLHPQTGPKNSKRLSILNPEDGGSRHFFVASVTLYQETLRCSEKLRSAFLLLFIRTLVSFFCRFLVILYFTFYSFIVHNLFSSQFTSLVHCCWCCFLLLWHPCATPMKMTSFLSYTVREMINRFKIKVTVGKFMRACQVVSFFIYIRQF